MRAIGQPRPKSGQLTELWFIILRNQIPVNLRSALIFKYFMAVEFLLIPPRHNHLAHLI
jgi:hypothetical protein